MTKYAIPLGKGELPMEARSTDEEMDAVAAKIKAAHPTATVLIERIRGGAVKITVAAPEYGLQLTGNEETPG